MLRCALFTAAWEAFSMALATCLGVNAFFLRFQLPIWMAVMPSREANSLSVEMENFLFSSEINASAFIDCSRPLHDRFTKNGEASAVKGSGRRSSMASCHRALRSRSFARIKRDR